MARNVSTTSIYLLAGMRAEFSIPRNDKNPKNAFASKNTEYAAEDGTTRDLSQTNGFYVEDEDVGEIEEVATDKVAVTYLHKKAEKNTIWFVAANQTDLARFDIIAVPIHDHSTIVQGGPAYGTYFSDSEED